MTVTSPDPRIQQSVRLRPAVPRDAAHLRRWRSEPSVQLFQPLSNLSVGQLRSDLANQRQNDLYRGKGDRFQWIVTVDGKDAGWVTLVVTNWEHGLAEVGYALSSDYQGRGLMLEALRLLLGEVFSRTSLERVEARCAVGNTPSQRVLEELGFQREGRLRSYFRLRGRRVDNYLYAIVREDYLKRSAHGAPAAARSRRPRAPR